MKNFKLLTTALTVFAFSALFFHSPVNAQHMGGGNKGDGNMHQSGQHMGMQHMNQQNMMMNMEQMMQNMQQMNQQMQNMIKNYDKIRRLPKAPESK